MKVANKVSKNKDCVSFTQQQFEELLRRIPQQHQKKDVGYNTDDEPDKNFAGMNHISDLHIAFTSKVHDFNALTMTNEWILDTGAIDHITPHFSDYHTSFTPMKNSAMTLPTGQSSPIKGLGNIKLSSNLTLHNVLCVPSFK